VKILIVGGAGYVGGALTDILKKLPNISITVYDNLLYEDSYFKEVDFVYGDVRDTKKLLSLLKQTDVVIWLAAIVGDSACAINPHVSKEINQDSVKWLAKNFDGKIFYMSTCSVYGVNNKVLDEKSETKPLSIYASTKLAAEQYLKDKNAIIFRLGTLFGVGDRFSRIRMDLVVNTFIMLAYKYNRLSVFGGDQFRPLLHVKDAAKTIAENLSSEKVGVYNLCYKNIKIKDLAYQIKTYFPDAIIEQTQLVFDDIRNYRVSANKAKTELKFNPTYSLDDGIKEIKTLLVENRIKNAENPRYFNHLFLEGR
jgi:nucleoside-diphosphate-sugar epimerase